MQTHASTLSDLGHVLETPRADVATLGDRLVSKRARFAFAQASMVVGYLALIFNPFDGDAMLLGLMCQAAALMLYVSSK